MNKEHFTKKSKKWEEVLLEIESSNWNWMSTRKKSQYLPVLLYSSVFTEFSGENSFRGLAEIMAC